MATTKGRAGAASPAREPLTPADCDLRDFPFMPLHVARFRDSELAAERSLEEIGAAALLWSVAWHQVPAASLPNSDKALTRFVGFGRDIAEFQRIREGALHGFILCSDDRLYHPLVAREAKIAWQSKLLQRWKTECARIKKHNQRHNTRYPHPKYETFVASGCVKALLPVPGDTIGTHPECPPGNDIHRDRDRDTELSGYPSQETGQVISLGGSRA